ncbi:MAG: TetR/AcrR family transcriptional regulator [Acidimicrobiia bacterium]|nr:TetR/AcrR family transcriptional regulator [Acidimicrobiia bacterium]
MARRTRQNILDVAGNLFGHRGFDAVSLDQIAAEVGVAKQTLLYWFASKDELIQEVLSETAIELTLVIEAAIRSAPDDPLDRMEAVVKAVFRPAVRRPSLLGLVREISRLPSESSERLTDSLRPLVERAVSWMRTEMDAGRLRRADPALIVALAYAFGYMEIGVNPGMVFTSLHKKPRPSGSKKKSTRANPSQRNASNTRIANSRTVRLCSASRSAGITRLAPSVTYLSS